MEAVLRLFSCHSLWQRVTLTARQRVQSSREFLACWKYFRCVWFAHAPCAHAHAHATCTCAEQCAMCNVHVCVGVYAFFTRGYGIFSLFCGAVRFSPRPRPPRAGGPWPAARFFAFFDTLHFSMYTTLFYVVYPCYPLSRSRKRASPLLHTLRLRERGARAHKAQSIRR